MKDLDLAKKIVGMKVIKDCSKKLIWLSQEKCIEKALKRFNMDKAKLVSVPLPEHFKLSTMQCPTNEEEKKEMSRVPYSSVVGILMYAMICTRPDIAHAVGVVSQFLSHSGEEHWNAVKWILRYLRGTTERCSCFGNEDPMLVGYTNVDMVGDADSRKSTSGCLTTFAGGVVSWQSKLQRCVALSTTEVEYSVASEAGKEVKYMKNLLHELGHVQERHVLHVTTKVQST